MRNAILAIMLSLAAFLGGQNAYSQEVDTLSVPSPVDSLSARLNKLQYDYDFLYCEYKLYQQATDLKLLSLAADNSAGALLVQFYNSTYNREMYYSYSDLYESDYSYFEVLKQDIEVVKTNVMIKMLSPDFTERDIKALLLMVDVIDGGIKNVEASLRHFSAVLDAYREKR